MDIKSFYIPNEFQPVWEKFIELQAKTGKTRSQIICELIKEFTENTGKKGDK